MSALAPGWLRRLVERLVPDTALRGWRCEHDFVGHLPVVAGVGVVVGMDVPLLRSINTAVTVPADNTDPLAALERLHIAYHQSRLERVR